MLELPSIGAAAKVAGVSEPTLFRWLQAPDFQERYRQARRLVMEQTIGRLQAITGEAIAVLREIMLNPKVSATPRVLAAKTVLETSIKVVELDDLASRVEELERRLEGDTEPRGTGAYLPHYARHRNGGA